MTSHTSDQPAIARPYLLVNCLPNAEGGLGLIEQPTELGHVVRKAATERHPCHGVVPRVGNSIPNTIIPLRISQPPPGRIVNHTALELTFLHSLIVSPLVSEQV